MTDTLSTIRRLGPDPVVVRAAGYYWVKVGLEPEPACWNGQKWTVIGGRILAEAPVVVSEAPLVFCAPE